MKENNLQLVDNLLQIVGLNLTGHNLHHLLADLTDLLVLSIRSLSDLVGALFGETNAEQAQKVAIGCLDIDVGFNHGLQEDVYKLYFQVIQMVIQCNHPTCTAKNYQHLLCKVNVLTSSY